MEERIYAIFAEVLGVRADAVVPSDSPETLPNWDSTNHLRIVLALEEAFGVEFDEDEILELISVESIVAALRAKVPA